MGQGMWDMVRGNGHRIGVINMILAFLEDESDTSKEKGKEVVERRSGGGFAVT